MSEDREELTVDEVRSIAATMRAQPSDYTPLEFALLATLIASSRETDRQRALVSERTAQARKMAATLAYFVDDEGVWPKDDPWPDRVDELCEKLKDLA